MTSSLVMLRTSFAIQSVSTSDRWWMISILTASTAASSSSSEVQLVWLDVGSVSLHPLKGSRQSPQVLWYLSHHIWQRRCRYCLQQGSWTLRSQVSDFRWHTKHSYSLVMTSGSSCFSLLLCPPAILFYINIKYTIRMMPKDILVLCHVWYLFRFLLVLWLFYLVHSRLWFCEECDVHFFFIQKRVHNIAWTWCHFLHVRSMAWTERMFQMKMQIFCAQTKKQAKSFFSERFFISSWKMSVMHKKASMRNEGQGERNKCQDRGQYANFLCTCTKKQARVTNGIMLLSFLTRM